jgi:hypothetical protein
VDAYRGMLPASASGTISPDYLFDRMMVDPGHIANQSGTLMKATLPNGDVRYGTAADFEANKMQDWANTIEPIGPSSPEWQQASQQVGLWESGPQSSAWQSLTGGPQSAGQTGSVNPGGMPGSSVGGAGKLSPNFVTPELDRQAEVTSAGKRMGPGIGQPQAPGRPFGMGAPQGGMAVGQGPFGMARPAAPQIAPNNRGTV